MDRISKNNLIQDYKIQFINRFNELPSIVSIAPGRVNIIGEHTDYNKGFAIPAAVNRWILTLGSLRKDRKVNVFSLNYKKTLRFSYDEFNLSGELWEKYVKASIFLIKEKYNVKKGFNILIGGNIPIGFGLSSSAALEVSIVSSIVKLFALNIDKYEILKICNLIENKILGIKSGFLDQYASIFSNKNRFLLIDFENLTHEYFDSNINNGCWILVNSMVDRKLIFSDYNQRVIECGDAIDFLNQKIKQKLDFNSISRELIGEIKQNKIFYDRLLHIITENQRVFKMKKAILSGDLNLIGKILNQSHDSLANNYNVSCNEIDFIIDISKKENGFLGGRIMGGGFGGCTINLIDKKFKKEFISNVKNSFYKKYRYNIVVEEFLFSSGLSVFQF